MQRESKLDARALGKRRMAEFFTKAAEENGNTSSPDPALAQQVKTEERNGVATFTLPAPPPTPERVKNLKPLSPWVRPKQMEKIGTAQPGEWYGLRFPTTLSELRRRGAEFLTQAFHAAGTLPKDNKVTRVTAFKELQLFRGSDCAGGAGHKAFLTVEYAKPSNDLHTELFAKVPWEMDKNEQYRIMLSMYGDGDGLELSTYVFLEHLLPCRIPKYYYADMNRESTNYLLITEKIPYGDPRKT